MKNVCAIFFRTLVISIAVTQAVLFAGYKAGISLFSRPLAAEAIYLTMIIIVPMVQIRIIRPPAFPMFRLREILMTDGYSAKFYKILFDWGGKCEKKGQAELALLTEAALLIDGGHYNEGFARLDKIKFSKLEKEQKQVYYNTYLYGAVICGDLKTAQKIYESGEKWLFSVTSYPLTASVKHTLGCFEYLRGNKVRAEEMFMQSLDNEPVTEVMCEVWLALAVCYAETRRKELAHKALKTAAGFADTVPLKAKLLRAREAVG